MIKKIINYTDFNGLERKGEFYFHLTEHELTRMEMGIKGGLTEKINRIVEAQDSPAIIEIFEDLIQKSFGVKTPDGGFVKRKEDLDAFMATQAYSDLFMELATDSEAASAFIKGIIPANLAKKVEETVPATN